MRKGELPFALTRAGTGVCPYEEWAMRSIACGHGMPCPYDSKHLNAFSYQTPRRKGQGATEVISRNCGVNHTFDGIFDDGLRGYVGGDHKMS